MRPNRWMLAGVLLLSISAGRGMAAVPVASVPVEEVKPTDPARLPALVKQLQSTDFRERDDATVLLMRLPADQRSAVEQVLAKASDQETETRLERVAVHLFMKGETSFGGTVGLLGIRMSPELVRLDDKSEDLQPAIAIIKLEPGFPAAEELEVGDRVVGMDGELFSQNLDVSQLTSQFQETVHNTAPGTSRRLLVLRGSKLLQVDVKVAGLRPEDGANVLRVVEWRDEEAADYRAGLRKGVPAKPLLLEVVGGAPPVEANDNEGEIGGP